MQEEVFNTKFSKDVGWNIGSLGVVGVIGILINIIIVRFYDTEALGIFNQCMAIYLVGAQIAVGGFHLSVLKYSSEKSVVKSTISAILLSGLICTCVTSIIVCGVVYATLDLIAGFFESDKVGIGILCLLPGLFLFSLNKVFFAVFNGLRHMRIYAVGLSLRLIFILAFIIGSIIANLQAEFLPLAFSVAEVVLIIIFSVYSIGSGILTLKNKLLSWLKTHISFGTRGFLNGFLLDINPRVDVIMLGVFMSDSAVGIYSFAAMLAEGIAQLPVILQTNLNPILTRITMEKRFDDLKATVEKTFKVAFWGMLIVSVLALACYPLITTWLVGADKLAGSWVIFAILLTGIIAAAGYTPFVMILTQAGYPGYFTLFLILVVGTNIVLNYILIPLIGLHGAALATMTTFIASVFYLKLLVRSILKIWI